MQSCHSVQCDRIEKIKILVVITSLRLEGRSGTSEAIEGKADFSVRIKSHTREPVRSY